MFKRILVALVVLSLVFSLAACKPRTPPITDPEKPAFKIGIMTGTVAQNEEEFRMAERMQAKSGSDMILHQPYPTNFTQEQETIITNMLTMASDPDVKALVLVQAVAGSCAAIDKVREIRPDMLIIMGTPGEDPDLVATKGDIIFQVNDLARGASIADQAKAMGAKKLIHYSFPRHMSNAMLSARRDLMEQRCKETGLEFIFVDAPDPMGEGSIPNTQQFILEDVPRQIAEHGTEVAFFGTNCAMMEPLMKQVIAGGAIMPVQCCPSPYHALPAALQIEIPEDKKGDIPYALAEIKEKLTEADAAHRISTWPAPVNMLYIEAGVEYAIMYLNGQTNGKVDEAKIKEAFKNQVQLEHYKDHPHYFLILADYVDFTEQF